MDTPLDKLSYSIQGLAAATELSVDSIQKAIKRNDLIPSYYGVKPLIPVEEARRWLSSLPNERPERVA